MTSNKGLLFISFTSIVSRRHGTVLLRNEQMQFVSWDSGFCPSTRLTNLQLNRTKERSSVIACNWKNSSGNAVVWDWFLLMCSCMTAVLGSSGAVALQVVSICIRWNNWGSCFSDILCVYSSGCIETKLLFPQASSWPGLSSFGAISVRACSFWPMQVNLRCAVQ